MRLYLIVCRDCDGDAAAALPVPFTDREERGRWRTAHTESTGHTRFHVIDQIGADA